jgi:hypothetical protein
MKRFKVYYIGLILAIVSMNWLTHFAVEPSINFNNVYTQRALLETLILLTSVVMLLLFTYRNSIIIKVLFFLSQVAAALLFIFLLIELVKAEAILFNIPYYLVYLYCLIFNIVSIYQNIIRAKAL